MNALPTVLVCIIVCLALVLAISVLLTTLAHGCERIEPRDVMLNGEWYLILKRTEEHSPWEGETVEIWETVPLLETELSPDSRYWRCANADGSRKAFLVPSFRR